MGDARGAHIDRHFLAHGSNIATVPAAAARWSPSNSGVPATPPETVNRAADKIGRGRPAA